jgi:hypothetical protein
VENASLVAKSKREATPAVGRRSCIWRQLDRSTDTISMDPQTPADLPPDLRAFLYSCIGSVAQLDLLVRLRASGQAATVRDLSALVGLPPATVRHDLEALTARGLLRAQVGPEVEYRYAPATPELARFGDLSAAHYTDNRETVIRFITARAARTFADAFKIRKDP